ncbi:MAG: lactate utilization protein [Desulfarculus sp.]|nr:MAG: lactate utilization protein [Desulfarculus sp.]
MRLESLQDQFQQRIAVVGGRAQTVPDLEAALGYVVRLTQELGGRTLAAPGWGQAELERIQAVGQQAGLEVFSQGLRAQAKNIFCGFTPADWGVAQTGTLVIDSLNEDLRLATMLSEVHVAVLPAARLRPDLPSLQDELGGILQRPQAYLAMITGPSRTGDIELILTMGAHGPRQVHVLILEAAA